MVLIAQYFGVTVMKKNFAIYFTIIVFSVFCVMLAFFILDDDYVSMEQNKNIDVEFNAAEIDGIEYQAQKIVKQYNKDACLSSVVWKFSSKQEVIEKTGTIVFKYYALSKNIKKHDIYIAYEIKADINKKRFINLKKYGNRTTGGEKLNKAVSLDTIYEKAYDFIDKNINNNLSFELDIADNNVSLFIIENKYTIRSARLINYDRFEWN